MPNSAYVLVVFLHQDVHHLKRLCFVLIEFQAEPVHLTLIMSGVNH